MKRTNTNSSSSSSQALESGFLSKNLVNNELIRRLKVVTETLEGYTDEDDVIEQAKRDIEHLADAVGSDWLIQHKNKDVRLLVACALADILRIYAPDPPYGEDTSVAVIRLFLKILRGFESPDMTPQHPSYSIHFYLLERLNVISIFSIINELVNFRDELLKELARAAYNIAGNMVAHTATHKVTEHLTAILCCVIEEIELYDMDLFDLVVGALCKNEKKENPAGYTMMKTVIASCENHFQPFIERHIHQVKAGLLLESELTNGERLSEAVFELSSIAPRVLTQILPAYAEDLIVEDAAVRIKAIKLLGAVFSVGNFSRDFASVFAEFKRRSLDKESEVRRTMVSVLGILLQRKSELSKTLLEDNFLFQGEQRDPPMYSLVVDGDERIRKEAVETVLELGLASPEAVPLSFLRHIADRTLDRRPTVRQAAVEGLCRLYQKFCAPYDGERLNAAVTEKYGWIPSRVATLIPSADQELRVFLVRCLEEVCMGVSSECGRSPPLIAADLYASLNEKGREQFLNLLRGRAKFQDGFLRLAALKESSSKRDLLDESTDKEEAAILVRLSQSFADPSRAQDLLQKLMDVKIPKVWEPLADLIRKPRGDAFAGRVLDEVLRRLGPKSALIELVKQLVARIADKFFGFDFVELVLKAITAKEKEESSALRDCLPILPVLASLQPSLFVSQQKYLKLGLLDSSESQDVVEHILKVIVLSANELQDLKDDDKVLDKLTVLCVNDSPKISKFAARSLIKMTGDGSQECKALTRSCLAALNFSTKLPGIFAALSEVAKGAPKLLKSSDQSTVITFAKKLLHQGWTASGKKDKKLIASAKCHATKLLTALILGSASQEGKKDEKRQNELIQELFEIVSKQGDIGSDSSSEPEKAMLRLTAGSCVLKIGKVKELRDLISPRLFLSVSLLCEDEDISVRREIVKKIWKGAGVMQGKLPFHFVAMLVLGAHDSDATQLDYVKTILKNILALMKKLRSNSGKAVMSIAPEKILPWLVYLLANHPKFLDADEDDAQVSISFKKYLDLFLNTLTQSGTDEKIFPMLWQTLDHIKCCEVAAGALVEDGFEVVPRNVGIICEVGKRLVTKFGGHKKWDSDVLRDHLSKLVDTTIFVRRADSAQAYVPTIPDGFGMFSPPKKSGSSLSTPASSVQKSRDPLYSTSGGSPSARKRLLLDQTRMRDTGDDSEANEAAVGSRTMPSRGSKISMRSLQEVSEDEDESAAEENPRREKAEKLSPFKGRRPTTTRASNEKKCVDEEKESPVKQAKTSGADKAGTTKGKRHSESGMLSPPAAKTPKKADVPAVVDSPVQSSPAGRRSVNSSKPTANKSFRESPIRAEFSSPGASQTSSASPRVSTAHAEQVLASAKARSSRASSKRARDDVEEEPSTREQPASKPSSNASKPTSNAASRKRKAPAESQSKAAPRKSQEKDDFDFDEDDEGGQREDPRARTSETGSAAGRRASQPSPASKDAPHKARAPTKSPASKLAASPAAPSPESPVAPSRAPVKGRASASHEDSSSALERLDRSAAGSRKSRRSASPAPPPAPQAKAPPPQSKGKAAAAAPGKGKVAAPPPSKVEAAPPATKAKRRRL